MDAEYWPVRVATVDGADVVGRLLDDVDREFDTPTPGPDVLAHRLRSLLATHRTIAILAGSPAIGVAPVRLGPCSRSTPTSSAPSCYMTNSCVASAAAAEPLGFTVEVLSDATGAIPLSNSTGSVSAMEVHETVMTLLSSNWAAAATTDAWIDAVRARADLPRSNLAESAMAGRSVG